MTNLITAYIYKGYKTIDQQPKIDGDVNEQRHLFNATNKIITLFKQVREVLNSNATHFKSFNNITTAFQYMVNSPGWAATDTFVNTIGKSSNIPSGLGSQYERIEKFKQMKTQHEKEIIKEDEEAAKRSVFNREIKDVLKQMVSDLKVMKKKIFRRFPKLQKRQSYATGCSNKNCENSLGDISH